MNVTKQSTTGKCERCGLVRYYVLASAFQGDGTATFRFLCGPCDRIEKPRNQPSLFQGMYMAAPVEPEEQEPEPEIDLLYTPQMSLF